MENLTLSMQRAFDFVSQMNDTNQMKLRTAAYVRLFTVYKWLMSNELRMVCIALHDFNYESIINFGHIYKHKRQELIEEFEKLVNIYAGETINLKFVAALYEEPTALRHYWANI